jgi:hypothetical protein
MSKHSQTKIIKETFGNPDKAGKYSGAYIFCNGTAEFVCGYQAHSGESNGIEEYYNVMPATPQQVYARYGRLEDGLLVAKEKCSK